MGVVVHPRLAARRGGARAATWWGRAWVRAVEEASYDEAEVVRGRALARSGRIGQIRLDAGSFVAAVEDERGLWTVAGTVPVLDNASRAALVEAVAAQSGRVAALLAGDLPHDLVEHAEEAGVELLPYGGELGATCTCESWTDPCVHALGVLQQLAWLLDADPFVLLHLRGLPRDDLLAELHRHADPGAPEGLDDPDDCDDPDLEADLEAGFDAAARAARVLELLADPDRPLDHLF